jgi:hypothetical protein
LPPARTRVVTERGSIDRVADAVERGRMDDAARVTGPDPFVTNGVVSNHENKEGRETPRGA